MPKGGCAGAGAIIAMVGSANPKANGGQYNLAVWPPRNPGSSMKIFTYTAAIASGKFSMTTPISDSRFSYRDPMSGEDGWEQAFARRHPLETWLMMRFWRSLAGDANLDPAEEVNTLERVDELLREHAAGSAKG